VTQAGTRQTACRLRRALARSSIRTAASVFAIGATSVSFYLGNLKHGVTTLDFVKDFDIEMSNGRARHQRDMLALQLAMDRGPEPPRSYITQ
jgi:hypothetical protein